MKKTGSIPTIKIALESKSDTNKTKLLVGDKNLTSKIKEKNSSSVLIQNIKPIGDVNISTNLKTNVDINCDAIITQKSETETSKDETPKAQSSSESVESEANKSVTAVADEKSQAQKSETETSKDETPKAQSSSESVESEANKSVTVVADEKSQAQKSENRDI